jgi:hypothetical protein
MSQLVTHTHLSPFFQNCQQEHVHQPLPLLEEARKIRSESEGVAGASDPARTRRNGDLDIQTAVFGGALYTYFPQVTTWEVAQQQCEVAGSNLVSFETFEEEEGAMKKLMANVTEDVSTWIGCNKRSCL